MIIVSQDKEVIVNFDNVENIWINNPLENNEGKFEIRAETYSNNMLIGEYKTEERAKEVLQEISNWYGLQDLKQMDCMSAIAYTLGRRTSIYTMPKE